MNVGYIMDSIYFEMFMTVVNAVKELFQLYHRANSEGIVQVSTTITIIETTLFYLSNPALMIL